MAIRTLFVDLCGVVVRAATDQTYQRFAGHAKKSPSEVEKLISQLNREFDEALLSPREFFSMVLLELGVIIREAEFWDCWRNIFHVEPEVVQILREARENGVEVIAASNLDPVRFESVKATGALEPFHKIGLSYRFRSRKPDADFYRKLAALTESRPQECLFIDDMEENVRAAAEFGFVVIQHTRADLLRRALQGFGVLP